MDSEFPDPDEEFDLVHEDEYEVLKEIEELEKRNFTQPQQVKTSHHKPAEKKKDTVVANGSKESNIPASTNVYNELSTSTPTDVYKELNTPPANVYKELNVPTTSKYNDPFNIPGTSKDIGYTNLIEVDNAKKRNYDDLFGDISDIVDINGFDIQEPREKKPRWDHPQEVIKAVLEARERFQQQSTGISVKKNHAEAKKDTISLRVPRWNFIAVTRPRDAQRIYIRVKNDEAYHKKTTTDTYSNLLLVPFSQLKAEAEEIIVEKVQRASCETSNSAVAEITQDYELWVDKYRPRTYIELLSDESVNRHLLHWLRLWDKVVFNRNYVQTKKRKLNLMFGNKKFANEKTPEKEVDDAGFPVQRIVLLSGPPGLGKTTLAHLAVKHAGYKVVEINASDERSPDAFRQILLASTQMKAVMGSDPRPNCLILDEIDGAPAASIELLLKFVQGKLAAKGKKDNSKGDKRGTTCQRPVICICNEPYTPSLRALRAAALIIPVPEVSPMRLADRLLEVARKEDIKVNSDALLKLAEISGCDVRSCLGALQYMGGANLGDNLSFALKDSRKGLFDSWKQILTVPMNRNGILPLPERVRSVMKTVQHGESEKLVQGIFHNYPELCNDKLNYVDLCLQWFQFFDEILSLVLSVQAWSLMPYTNYAFVTWHLYFAKSRNVKLSYPSISYEVNQKLAKSVGILTTIHRSSGRDSITLAVDIAPFLPDLLSPRVRTVSGHLHSSKEKDDIIRLVNVLIEYGLTFTQEKSLDGTYDYKLDPNIFEIGIFPNCKHHRTLVYAVKQIIVQELEAERLRRAVNATQNINSSKKNRNENTDKTEPIVKTIESKETAKTKNVSPNDEIENVASNAKTSNATASKPANKIETETKQIKYKDFFGRIVTITPETQKSDKESTKFRNLLTKHGVWYKYKEGFSNAVRRNITMADVL